MRTAQEIFAFLELLGPTIWEWVNDKHGENKKEKRHDVPIRMALMVTAATINAILLTKMQPELVPYLKLALVQYFKALCMTFALFFLLFDYGINAILLKNGVIEGKDMFSYMSKSDMDQLWAHWHPGCRLALRIVVLALILIIYL